MGHPFRQDSGRGNNDGDERQSKGVQQGQLQERMETIREALDMKMPLENIAKLVRLPVEEVRKLIAEIEQ